MSISHTTYAIRNVGAAGVFQILALLLSFVSRTVFVKLLGNDYLSCEGLFSNILTILSFSELGIGSSIIYSLYKPVAEDDRVQIGKLMNFFRTSYILIAVVIAAVGLLVVPFMDYIVKDVPSVKESITVLYLLFLANTVSSYIFGYKRSFLIACQKNYVVLGIQQVATVIRIVLQIGVLFWFHNYVLYLVIAIVCTLAGNVVSTYITNRQYSWMNEYLGNKLTKEECKPIFRNIFAIVQYKLGYVFLQGAGNILISLCLSTSLVGLCSNYNLITGAISTLFTQFFTSIQSTVGNFNTMSNPIEKRQLFLSLYFINYWVSGFVVIMTAIFISPFISHLWLGREYELGSFTTLAICFSFYAFMSNRVPSLFRSAMGLFVQAKNSPIYASVLNIMLAIVLSKWIGLAGIFIAHGIAHLLSFSLIDPYYIFKIGLKASPFIVYKRMIIYGAALILIFVISSFIIGLIGISNDSIMGFIGNILITTVLINVLLLILFFRTDDFRLTYNYVKAHL